MPKVTHRADFKIEELVEFVRAASSSEEEFQDSCKHAWGTWYGGRQGEKIHIKTGRHGCLIDTSYRTAVLFWWADPETHLILSMKQYKAWWKH